MKLLSAIPLCAALLLMRMAQALMGGVVMLLVLTKWLKNENLTR